MKMLRNKQALQKIIIALVILILFNFIFPVYSRAAWWGGGSLFDPIRDLVCGIGDAVINVLQSTLLPGSPKAIDKKSPSVLLEEMYRKAGNEEKANELKNSNNNHYWIGWLADWIGGDTTRDFYAERIIPVIVYSPAAIFSNLIPALDVNFINPNVTYDGGNISYLPSYDSSTQKWQISASYTENSLTEEEKLKSNTAYQLQDTIATWYTALRNIAIVGLLSVLVYVAIRIIISSTAGETAKYKSMLKDWLVALCILFFMHYMMAFLLKSTEMITDLFVSNQIMSSREDAEVRVKNLKVDTFMSSTRELAQNGTDSNGDADAGVRFAYTLMYVVLIFYTLMFTWKYLKRFIYLAFLTMISPMVALTYPIDKIKDGHAQAFNMWFKEYVFNVLIQPIHLILYTILVSSAESFAQTNLIYSVVAIGFMLEAEKIVKSLFGFKTEGGISSAGAAITGGAIFGAVSGWIQKGANKLPAGSSSSKGSSGGSKEGKVRFNDRDKDSDATNNLSAFKEGDSESIGSEESIRQANVSSPASTDSSHTLSAYANRNRHANVSGPASASTATNTQSSGRTGKYNYRPFNAVSNAYHALGTPYRAVKRGLQSGSSKFRELRPVKGIRKLGSDIARTPGGRLIRGVGRVAGRFVNKDNAKKAVRLAAMGVGAATLGTIGLAAGIASDNDGDVLKYAGLGVGAGALVGGKTYDTASALGRGASGVKDSFQQGFYGSEYETKILNPRLDKEWKKDKDVKEYYRTKYGDDYKARMEDALQLRKAGITDQKEIDTAIKLMKNNDGLTVDQAANIMQFTSGINRSDVLNNERWNGIRESAKKMVGNSDEKADDIMKLVNQRFKLHKDLHFDKQ